MVQGAECHAEVVEEDLVAEAVVAGAEVAEVSEGAGVGDKNLSKNNKLQKFRK